MGRLTESLLDFIAAMPDRPLPASMIALARTGFTDAVGVMAAGVHEPVVARLMAYVGSQGGSAEARLLLGSQRARASDAALVGATAAQVLDYDDYAYHNHPSAVLVPAILAEAEALSIPIHEDADLAALRKAGAKPVWDAWVKDATANGLPAQELLDLVMSKAKGM